MAFASTARGAVIFVLALAASLVAPAAAARRLGACMACISIGACVSTYRKLTPERGTALHTCVAPFCCRAHHLEANHLQDPTNITMAALLQYLGASGHMPANQRAGLLGYQFYASLCCLLSRAPQKSECYHLVLAECRGDRVKSLPDGQKAKYNSPVEFATAPDGEFSFDPSDCCCCADSCIRCLGPMRRQERQLRFQLRGRGLVGRHLPIRLPVLQGKCVLLVRSLPADDVPSNDLPPNDGPYFMLAFQVGRRTMQCLHHSAMRRQCLG